MLFARLHVFADPVCENVSVREYQYRILHDWVSEELFRRIRILSIGTRYTPVNLGDKVVVVWKLQLGVAVMTVLSFRKLNHGYLLLDSVGLKPRQFHKWAENGPVFVLDAYSHRGSIGNAVLRVIVRKGLMVVEVH